MKEIVTSTGSVITLLPGGEKLLWGGTRKSVKLSRPVEAGTMWDPTKTKCPYHREDEKSLAEFDGEGGTIRVLGNAFTPHYKHKLVIPKECTNEEFVRTLGGEKFIGRCLAAIDTIAEQNGPEEWVFAVHVLRGQNVPHLHWHMYAYHPEEELCWDHERSWCNIEANDDLVIMETSHFQVVARGTKVGQLMLIPFLGYDEDNLPGNIWAEAARALHQAVALTNEAFKSTQGERPRYSVTGRIGSDGTLLYITYVPDLQMYGCSDDAADFNGTARARAWSPMETAEYLRKFIK